MSIILSAIALIIFVPSSWRLIVQPQVTSVDGLYVRCMWRNYSWLSHCPLHAPCWNWRRQRAIFIESLFTLNVTGESKWTFCSLSVNVQGIWHKLESSGACWDLLKACMDESSCDTQHRSWLSSICKKGNVWLCGIGALRDWYLWFRHSVKHRKKKSLKLRNLGQAFKTIIYLALNQYLLGSLFL